jgi:apolipoprotein N-acyltransferase
MVCGAIGVTVPAAPPTPTATAVLIQPNLDVSSDSRWNGPGEWDQHIAEFEKLASVADTADKSYIAGIPETGAPTGETIRIEEIPKASAPTGEIMRPPNETHPALIAWPESPAPFMELEARFRQSLKQIAQQEHAPIVVGNIGIDEPTPNEEFRYYNSALIVGEDGERVGRYDKIHLVPFGEYIPFQNLLSFAHKLTGRVSSFSRGTERKVFRLGGHRYGVFICYEAVFADEVRHFAQLGAEVLVNISDDGWYGDTSAPWQHLNMARMRAIENRRWILRDTNNGVTCVIDPNGVVRQSIPRHQTDALPAEFGFRDDVTFYTEHGDVFGWVCVLVAAVLVALTGRLQLRLTIKMYSARG